MSKSNILLLLIYFVLFAQYCQQEIFFILNLERQYKMIVVLFVQVVQQKIILSWHCLGQNKTFFILFCSICINCTLFF